jgi:hypothetical protein
VYRQIVQQKEQGQPGGGLKLVEMLHLRPQIAAQSKEYRADSGRGPAQSQREAGEGQHQQGGQGNVQADTPR